MFPLFWEREIHDQNRRAPNRVILRRRRTQYAGFHLAQSLCPSITFAGT